MTEGWRYRVVWLAVPRLVDARTGVRSPDPTFGRPKHSTAAMPASHFQPSHEDVDTRHAQVRLARSLRKQARERGDVKQIELYEFSEEEGQWITMT